MANSADDETMAPAFPPPPQGSLPIRAGGGRPLVSIRMMSIVASGMYFVLALYQLAGALTLRYRSTTWRAYYVPGTGTRVEDAQTANEYVAMVSGFGWIVGGLTIMCASGWTFAVMTAARQHGHATYGPFRTAALWLIPLIGPVTAINRIREAVRAAGGSDQLLGFWLKSMYAFLAFYVVTTVAVRAGFDNQIEGPTGGFSTLAALNREVTVSYFNVLAIAWVAIAATRSMLHASNTFTLIENPRTAPPLPI